MDVTQDIYPFIQAHRCFLLPLLFFKHTKHNAAWKHAEQMHTEVNQSQTTQYTALKNHDTTLRVDIWEIMLGCPCWTALWMMYALGDRVNWRGGKHLSNIQPAVPLARLTGFLESIELRRMSPSTMMHFADFTGPTRIQTRITVPTTIKDKCWRRNMEWGKFGGNGENECLQASHWSTRRTGAGLPSTASFIHSLTAQS